MTRSDVTCGEDMTPIVVGEAALESAHMSHTVYVSQA